MRPLAPATRALAAAKLKAFGAHFSISLVLFAGIIAGTLRGGKGAAIWFGTMFMIAPLQVLVGMSLLGAFVVAVTRYVSLAVLSMTMLATIWVVVLISQQIVPLEYVFYMLVVTVMILYRFRENIQRLLAGTERRLGDPA